MGRGRSGLPHHSSTDIPGKDMIETSLGHDRIVSLSPRRYSLLFHFTHTHTQVGCAWWLTLPPPLTAVFSGICPAPKTCCYPPLSHAPESLNVVWACLTAGVIAIPLYGIHSMSRVVKPARSGIQTSRSGQKSPVLLLSVIPIGVRARVTVNRFKKRRLPSQVPTSN